MIVLTIALDIVMIVVSGILSVVINFWKAGLEKFAIYLKKIGNIVLIARQY